MIVDSHCHVSDRWYEPVEVLLWQMDRLGIDVGVLTQYSGQHDNSYQAECVQRHPGRFASVVVVDSSSASAPDDLERWVERGAVGVRFRASARATGADPLAVWRRAADLGVAATVLGSENDFRSEEFAALVEELPTLPILIEHLGTAGKTGLAYTEEAAAEVFALSRFANVRVKFHGLAEFSPRIADRTSREVFVRPLRPHLRMALEAFGPDRLLWGSDFPPVSAREGYGQSLELPRAALRELGLPPESLDAVFGGTAAALFGLDAEAERAVA